MGPLREKRGASAFSHRENIFGMIGIFDSGFGGLTVLKRIVERLPQYDYLYLGDNARAPYGGRSDAIVFEFTREAVEFLFKKGCPLIIIACNTSSAKALRKIQQEILPRSYPERRVLGVIRPSVEEVAEGTRSRNVGILATEGVVLSDAYIKELEKLDPDITVHQQACPLLVPIVEAGEQGWEGTGMIVRRYLAELLGRAPSIDTLLLACTHYPILYDCFRESVPQNIPILEQGPIVAEKLEDYLLRHPEIERRLGRGKKRLFMTTDTSEKFDRLARVFYGQPVESLLISLD
jgi:glutamate racemase